MSAKSAKSCDAHCGPLSLMMVSGTPNQEKMDFSKSITIAEVVQLSFWTSGYLEK